MVGAMFDPMNGTEGVAQDKSEISYCANQQGVSLYGVICHKGQGKYSQ